MTHACTLCGRFVPADFVAITRCGEYGAGMPEDETLCAACGGPACPSPAWVERAFPHDGDREDEDGRHP